MSNKKKCTNTTEEDKMMTKKFIMTNPVSGYEFSGLNRNKHEKLGSKVDTRVVNTCKKTERSEPGIEGKSSICEFVVDDLIEKNALGLLMSKEHFNTYLASIGLNHHSSTAIQLQILKQFSGFHIKEANLEGAELAFALDLLLSITSSDCMVKTSIHHESNMEVDAALENSWKYRKIIGG